MNWPSNYGVFAPPTGVPGATGVQGMPYGQQSIPAQQAGGYGLDRLPPMQGQPQQGFTGVPQQMGVPGMQQQPIIQTAAPQQQWGVPAAPQQQQWQQPQQQFQYLQQKLQPQGFIDPNTRIQGAGVPEHLQGRTWGQIQQQYQAPQPINFPAQQNQGWQPQQQPQQQQRPQGSFFQNPEGRTAEIVREQLQQVVLPMLAPVVQQSYANGATNARNQVASQVRDFAQLEPAVQQLMATAAPDLQANPQAWLMATRIARGQLMETGQYGRQQPAPMQQQWGSVPTHSQQPVHTFFSEAPSAPSAFGMGGSPQMGPSAQDYEYARKFLMPIGEYMQWKNGAQPQQVGSW